MLALINGILMNTLYCLNAFVFDLPEMHAQVRYIIHFRYTSTT